MKSMPLHNPLVSIALCTYNGEQYLNQQIESIINQTYNNVEIIIIDDCSTDSTFELLRMLTKDIKNVRLEQNQQNLGFIKNFEKAISYCNGEYIAISDQDDIWILNKIEILLKHIGNHGLIFHDSLIIDERGEQINDLKLSDMSKIYKGDSNLYFLVNNCIPGHASMFRKDIIAYAMPFDKRFFHDWWLAFVAASVSSITYIPETLVKYRQHNNNVTDILFKRSKNEQSRDIYSNYNLEWIEYLSKFIHLKNVKEIRFIYKVLSDYRKGIKGLPFIKFLVNYHIKLFNLEKKSYLSRLNLARKLYSAKSIK
ncbi:glycosyltransferase [Pedobacter petrophilus]|uniref:Glycosyltransferase n=1 Tax=Pedobacter petrophilus TaxID=1908241 RepID=A0A7K0FZ87_9SPHI|nr:glycosyltransferase family 2 protein [Pedobacter petrophilus]MRX76903.1 glycosyltransferase [Pedobacter petrophilus]